MKHLELKKAFKNKYMIRVAAGAVTIAVLGTSAGLSTYMVQAERNSVAAAGESSSNSTEATAKEDTANTTIENAENNGIEGGGNVGTDTGKNENGKQDNKHSSGQTDSQNKAADTDIEKYDENSLQKALSSHEKDEDAGKEETVYIVAAPDGSAKNVIVSEWLKNDGSSSSITDASDLKDIQNVKGDEAFSQNGENITWQANGKDIYYQGTTDRELPVTESVSYYLDGKKMAPEDMAGKSGNIKIRFDYENHETSTQVVDGEKHDVYVPFTVLTGMVLPEDYTNVKVTNGKVISDGNKKMVVGFAMPGLKESLEVKDSDLDMDMEIPDYVEVSADVENFSLEMTMSVVVNDLLSQASLNDAFDLTDLEEDMDTLSDASKELVDGSSDLSDGMGTLKDSMKEFSDGVNTLRDGIISYTNGASQLGNGINTLAGSSGVLMDGVSTLNSSAATLNQGIAELDKTLKADMSKQERQDLLKQADNAIEQTFNDKKSGSAAIQNQASSVFYDSLANDKKAKSQVQAGIGTYTENVLNSVLQTAFSTVAADTAKKDQMAQYKPQVVQAVTQQVVQAVTQQVTAGVTVAALQEQITQAAAAMQENGAALDAETIAQICAAVNAAVNTEGSPAKQQIDALIAQQDINGMVASNVDAQMAAVEAQIDAGLNSPEGQAQIQATVNGMVSQAVATAMGSDTLQAGMKQTAAQIVEGIAAGAKDTVGTAVADAAKTAAKTAAESSTLTAVSGTKAQISEAINAADAASGYSLVTGMQALSEGTNTMSNHMPALSDGISQLTNGASTLVSNNGELTGGAGKLSNAATQIGDGVDELEDGSKQLMDGMAQFDEDGIQKLTEAYNGDVKSLLQKLEAVENAGESYQTFTKLAKGTTGSVKFILRTESIKAQED